MVCQVRNGADCLVGAGQTTGHKDQIDDLLLWVTFGVILGGRLGYVVFYNFSHYLSNPGEILAVWQGGMSFHGGFLGVVIAVWLFARKHQLAIVSLGDSVATAAPFGLFFDASPISSTVNCGDARPTTHSGSSFQTAALSPDIQASYMKRPWRGSSCLWCYGWQPIASICCGHPAQLSAFFWSVTAWGASLSSNSGSQMRISGFCQAAPRWGPGCRRRWSWSGFSCSCRPGAAVWG